MTKLLIAVFFACASSARADGEECTFAVTVSSDRRANWVTYINGHKGDTFSFQGANADCDGTGCFPLTGSGSVPYAGFCASTCIANGWGSGLNVLRNQNGDAVGHGNCCVETNAVVSTTWTCKEVVHLAPSGATECDSGVTVPEDMCSQAALSILAANGLTAGRSLQVGSWSGACGASGWDGVPKGCSVQSGGDWAPHFNAGTSSCNDNNGYSMVCTGEPKASTQLFLEEKAFLEAKSEVMSRTQGFVMMLFVSSGLSMGLGYAWARGRRVVTDPLPLLA